MKKLLLILISVIFLFMLTGCSDKVFSTDEEVIESDWKYNLSYIYGAKVIDYDEFGKYAKDGSYYLTFVTDVTNIGSNPIEIDGSKFKLVDKNNNTYDSLTAYDLWGENGFGAKDTISLNPGLDTRIRFYFLVPDDVEGLKVTYGTSNNLVSLGDYEIYYHESESL